MEKIAFNVFITDCNADRIGLYKMINSFKYYHPDIPLYVFGSKIINQQLQKHKIDVKFLNPLMFELLWDKYETVVHIDADCIVTDRMDEILKCDYDIAVVRNNSDQGFAGSNPNGFNLNGAVDKFKYYNLGLFAIRKNEKFIKEWIQMNRDEGMNYLLFEQDTFNKLLLNNNSLKVKLLDPPEEKLYYGVANSYGTITNWDSWKDIQIVDSKLYLNNKLIKVLHNAGGSDVEKLNIDKLFKEPIVTHLKKITCTL